MQPRAIACHECSGEPLLAGLFMGREYYVTDD